MTELELLKKFAREVIQAGFDGSDLEGGEIQELGVKYKLLNKTAYDPKIHGVCQWDSEPGDAWFVFSDILKD